MSLRSFLASRVKYSSPSLRKGERKQKVAMGKEKAQEGGKKFGEVALWDVEAVLSPCQECNSHAAGIPSRSIPLAASAFVAARCVPPRPTNRRRRRSRNSGDHLSHLRASRRRDYDRLNTARRKCRSASTFWDSDFHYPTLQKPIARGRALMPIDLRVMARDP